MSWQSLSKALKAPCVGEVKVCVGQCNRGQKAGGGGGETDLLSQLVVRVDELHQATECLGPVLGRELNEERVDDGRDGVADHAGRVSDRGKDVGLDVLDDARRKGVEAESNVVLEQETGHGPDGDILGGELGEDIREVLIVLGDVVELLQPLCTSAFEGQPGRDLLLRSLTSSSASLYARVSAAGTHLVDALLNFRVGRPRAPQAREELFEPAGIRLPRHLDLLVEPVGLPGS